MGNVGPDGPQEMRQALEPHKLLTNTASGSKARNTGIILHKNWKTGKLYKHESGGLIGVEITNGNTTLFVMSAYLPTGLDAYGMPESFRTIFGSLNFEISPWRVKNNQVSH